MRRRTLILSIVTAAATAAVFISTGFTAERQAEPATIDAVMRLDAAPLANKMDRLEAELILLRTVATQLNEKVGAMQQGLEKMQENLPGQAKTQNWQYQILWNTSTTGANRLGEQGWEAVTSGTNAAGTTYILFKKPLPDGQAPD